MPAYGELGPAYNYVAEGYNTRTMPETGASNIVTGIILDYRAYDTLLETTVLFAATMGVLLALKAHTRRGRLDGRRRHPE
jgi:multisubunit Na+/H+ antiporter MnhB subunit